jgi:hypothetical protein
MGLEDWESATRHPALTIGEARLQAQLGVDHFRLPPVAEPINNTRLVNAKMVAPAVRFPAWHECPKCNRIGTEGNPFELADDGSRLVCINPKCGRNSYTAPVRFVVACSKGHIGEFPWVWWAHRRRNEGACTHPNLQLMSQGRSASLADLYVKCRSCGSSESLGDAFRPDSLGKTNCSGIRPWLHDREADCGAAPRVLQRGASNVHFPVVASALSIPPISEGTFQIIESQWVSLSAAPAEAVTPILESLSNMYGVPYDALLAAYREKKAIEGHVRDIGEAGSRAEEYVALSADRNDDAIGGYVPLFQNSVLAPPPSIAKWFDLIGAASRLREVRALAGFSRIEPYPVSGERIEQAIRDGHVAPLSKTRRNWLPAAEIRGEGIFLRFRTEAVNAWINANPDIAARVAQLETRSAQIASNRGYEREYSMTARLLLVHSFSHALIRQISIECGYSSSALRERLYIAEPTDSAPAMNGVLVYTGSPDSEGSLGGLVRLAEPKMLERIVLQTIRNAGWCGSDPVCIESDPRQSGDRISGAACHCCLLLPETACEKFNRELDRTMLIGDVDGLWKGFFGVEGKN